MSDEEYSTEEERRQSRSQRRRRAHDMSSSSDKEDDDVGDTDRSDRDKEDEADSAEELIATMDHYHNELIGGGAWTTKAKKNMREKYFISQEQHTKMEDPTLKVKIND